jgi:hypothetical protein
MPELAWPQRVRWFVQRFWQPTFACMTCMPGSLAAVGSLAHWAIALQTGLITGLLALGLSFTPAARLFARRAGSVLIAAGLTMIGDAWSHARHGEVRPLEVLATGLVSGLVALAMSYLLEDRARRVRTAWARLSR